MNEQFILKVLDYILNNIDKVSNSESWTVSAKLDDKERVEITAFNLGNLGNSINNDNYICDITVGGATRRVVLTQKTYNLIMYKLGEIEEKYINYKINIISSIIDYKEHKPLTNIDNLFDEN